MRSTRKMRRLINGEDSSRQWQRGCIMRILAVRCVPVGGVATCCNRVPERAQQAPAGGGGGRLRGREGGGDSERHYSTRLLLFLLLQLVHRNFEARCRRRSDVHGDLCLKQRGDGYEKASGKFCDDNQLFDRGNAAATEAKQLLSSSVHPNIIQLLPFATTGIGNAAFSVPPSAFSSSDTQPPFQKLALALGGLDCFL
jgi:hypothetical protein